MPIIDLEKINALAASRDKMMRQNRSGEREAGYILGSAVRDFILSQERSLQQIADAMGYSKAYVHDVINSRRHASTEFVKRLSKL